MRRASLLLLMAISIGHLKSQINQDNTIKNDGKFTEASWSIQNIIFQNDSFCLYLIKDKEDIHIGIKIKESIARYVDLYFEIESVLYNLHASFQSGERVLYNNEFTDAEPEWVWNNNHLWKVNTVSYRAGSNEKRSFKDQLNDYDGYEFSINRSLFKDKEIKLFLEMKGFTENVETWVFPNTSKYKRLEWKEISY